MGALGAPLVRAPGQTTGDLGSNPSLGTNFSLNIYHLYVGQGPPVWYSGQHI